MKKYRPKSFMRWLDTVDKDVWWELFEPTLIDFTKKDLIQKEYDRYVISYIREKERVRKLKELGI